jgi:hypothetical protein
MKPLLLISTMLLFNCVLISGQNIPHKANTIIITDTLSQSQFYSKITYILFESGYGILNTDKELGTITTTEKPYKNGGVKLILLIKDKRIVLRGDYTTGIGLSMSGVTSAPGWYMIEFNGAKNSPTQNAWLEMQKIADQIPGAKEYQLK